MSRRQDLYIELAERVLNKTNTSMTAKEIFDFASRSDWMGEDYSFLSKLKYPVDAIWRNLRDAIKDGNTRIRSDEEKGDLFFYIPHKRSSNDWSDVYGTIEQGNVIATNLGGRIDSVVIEAEPSSVKGMKITIKTDDSNVPQICYGLTIADISHMLSRLIETLREIYVINHMELTLQDFDHYTEKVMRLLRQHQISDDCSVIALSGSDISGAERGRQTRLGPVTSGPKGTFSYRREPEVNMIPSEIPTDCKDELWIFPEKFPMYGDGENPCAPSIESSIEPSIGRFKETENSSRNGENNYILPTIYNPESRNPDEECDPPLSYLHRRIRRNIRRNLEDALKYIKGCIPEKNNIIRVFVYDKNALLRSGDWRDFVDKLRSIKNSPPYPPIRLYLNNEEVSL